MVIYSYIHGNEPVANLKSVIILFQEFASHSEEMDGERVGQIMQGAVKDVQWIVEPVTDDLFFYNVSCHIKHIVFFCFLSTHRRSNSIIQ